MTGDLTAAFDFRHPDFSIPRNIPTLDQTWALTQLTGGSTKPPAGGAQKMPVQEPGTRPHRPTSCQLHADVTVDRTTSQVTAALTAGKYAFSVYGPDGFLTSFAGTVAPAGQDSGPVPVVTATLRSWTVELALANEGQQPVTYTLIPNDYYYKGPRADGHRDGRPVQDHQLAGQSGGLLRRGDHGRFSRRLKRAASPERRVLPAVGRVAGGPMSGWVSRFLAAIGVGGHKAEADMSYDPAVDDRSGDSDLDRPAEEPHR